jgi:hypothetical protein
LIVGGVDVGFRLSEIVDREAKELSEEEKKRTWVWYRDRWSFRPSGKLRFQIEERHPVGGRKCWADCTRHKVEDKVGEIVEGVCSTGRAVRAERLRNEQWRKQWEEERKRREEEQRRMERIRKEEERKRRMEQMYRTSLEEKSEAWFRARRLRRFIRACEAMLQGGSRPVLAGEWGKTWLGWAREHADRLDPMTNGFLDGERERITEPNNKEGEPGPAERSVGDVMQEMMFETGHAAGRHASDEPNHCQ